MKQAIVKTLNTFKISFPIIIGILMLISMLNPLFQKYYPKIFTGNYFIDPLIGAVGGSIAFGIPITSYIAGGELLENGVSLLAVTAFMLAWTSVGVAMIPIETASLGRKFAIIRNSVNFVASIIIAVLTILTLNIIQ